MKYEVEKAFCCIKDDSLWLKKLLIPSVIIFVTFLLMIISVINVLKTENFTGISMSVFILACFIWLFMSFSFYGFVLQYGHDRIKNENAPLPDWKNLSSFLFIAVKAMLGSFLYYLPVFLLSAVSVMIESAAKSFPDVFSFTSVIVNIVYNLVQIIYLVMFFIFKASFLKDFNMFSFINFAKVSRMLKGSIKEYFILVLLVLAVGVVCNVALILLILTIIGILVLPFVVMYLQIVMMDLIAQYVRIEEDSKKNITANNA